jgi:hypothetical protein
VKSLKLKLRPESAAKYNSPWNIATDFMVSMHLSPSEIKPMLDDYAAAEGVKMDTAFIAERLFYYTSGYPFLVSKMCKDIAEKQLPSKSVKEWTEDDLFTAFKNMLQDRGNTNFDTLIKNLQEYPELYDLVFSIIIDGNVLAYNPDNPVVSLGALHGIFAASEKGTLMIHNRIYRERIANMMISNWEVANVLNPEKKFQMNNFKDPYVLPNNALNLELALLKFQTFMREQYSRKDRDFLERNGRLVFLAFMKPIINGSGYDFKEPQISEEKRLDVIITFYQHKYVAELKIWRGKQAHTEGLNQLASYLDRQELTEGYLVIFDHAEVKTWDSGWVEHQGKRIFVAWV